MEADGAPGKSSLFIIVDLIKSQFELVFFQWWKICCFPAFTHFHFPTMSSEWKETESVWGYPVFLSCKYFWKDLIGDDENGIVLDQRCGISRPPKCCVCLFFFIFVVVFLNAVLLVYSYNIIFSVVAVTTFKGWEGTFLLPTPHSLQSTWIGKGKLILPTCWQLIMFTHGLRRTAPVTSSVLPHFHAEIIVGMGSCFLAPQ